MDIIQFNNVWKKYKKGEKFNSFRDSIPHLFKKIAQGKDQLEDQEFWAVKDVSFNIKAGEVVGIMGANGAGKSTVLKLLSRIIVPNKGNMQINGRLSALIEVTAGFHPDLTGRENVYLNGTILGMKRKEIDERLEEILEFSGIREFIDTPVKRYSSGMMSRLGFSVAAHMNPDILLVDEVLSVGDVSFQSKCSEKMRQLLKSGATIVLVSHNLSLVQSLCKRLILLNKGEVLKDGLTDDVIPYYENLILKKQEEELKGKIQSEYTVSVEKKFAINITTVVLKDETNHPRDKFSVGKTVAIDVEYEALQPLDQPVFCLEIIRADGVLCSVSRTNENGPQLSHVQGKGKIKIEFDQLNLCPGTYLLKISIWDKDLIHPFIIRNQDILRIEADKVHKQSEAVYIPKATWKI